MLKYRLSILQLGSDALQSLPSREHYTRLPGLSYARLIIYLNVRATQVRDSSAC